MEYSEIVRFGSVRRLSLDAAINRIRLVYPSLKSYFLSESESQELFKRLAEAFGNLFTFFFNLFCQHSIGSISYYSVKNLQYFLLQMKYNTF